MKIEQKSEFNSITTDDLKEDDIIILDNGQIIKFIGQIDIKSNQDYIFKTIWSPFATVKWMCMNKKSVDKLKVIITNR